MKIDITNKTFLGDFSGNIEFSMSMTIIIKWDNIQNHQGYYFVDLDERGVQKFPSRIFVAPNSDPYSPYSDSSVSYKVNTEEIYPGFWIYKIDDQHQELADEIGSPTELLVPSPHLGPFIWEKI